MCAAGVCVVCIMWYTSFDLNFDQLVTADYMKTVRFRISSTSKIVMAGQMGQSICKSAAFVGCSRDIVVSKYQKLSIIICGRGSVMYVESEN